MTTASAPKRTVRRRRRHGLAVLDPVAPVWWPEYVGLITGREKALRVAADYARRTDLATWLMVERRGVAAAWFAKRLGVSDQRIWNRVRAGRAYVERTGMTEEAVGELLFTPTEKLEARRRRRADRAQRLEERLADITLPPPPTDHPWLAPRGNTQA